MISFFYKKYLEKLIANSPPINFILRQVKPLIKLKKVKSRTVKTTKCEQSWLLKNFAKKIKK